MASGGGKDREDKDTDNIDKKQKDGDGGEGAGSWIMSGLKLGAALKIGAVLGVTTLGATAFGAVAVGAYAAMKVAQQYQGEEEPAVENTRGSKDDAKTEDALPPASHKPTSCGVSNIKETPSGTLIDDLNEYYHSHITASSAKRLAIKDLVEKARQPLSSHLIKNYGGLVEGELIPAAVDRHITRQVDERKLLLPLAFNPQIWEFIDAGDSVLEMPGYFCVHRVNLDSFSVGTSPWDPFLSGSYLCPELLQKFWMENIKQLLKKVKVLGFEYSIEWNSGSIQLNIENPIKGYADMLCIKIIPCMKVKKDGELRTIIGKTVTPLQKPAALSSIPQENLWIQSWEEEAVYKMETLDRDGGCRQQCLAILDALLCGQSTLKMLSLYHKMVILLKVCEEETEWEEEMLAERFLDLLKALEGYLRDGSLSDHFNEKVNILAQCCSPEDILESQKWLGHILESEDQLSDLLYDMLFKVGKH